MAHFPYKKQLAHILVYTSVASFKGFCKFTDCIIQLALKASLNTFLTSPALLFWKVFVALWLVLIHSSHHRCQ